MNGYQLNSIKWVACLSIQLLILFSQESFADKPHAQPIQTEHVVLLKHPCDIRGPFDKRTLKLIHNLGPDQIYPNLSSQDIENSIKQSKEALAKLRAHPSPNSLLDRYRERLNKRLVSQISFLTALLQFKNLNQIEPLLEVGGQYLQERDLKTLKNLLKKSRSPETIDSIFELFNEAIEPDPESEFHRAINKLNIQYDCAFERNEKSSSDE